MEKGDLMAIGTILKFALGFIGIIMTLVLLITGLVKKDTKKLKKAGLIFGGTWLILIILGTIEFLFLANI
jgi:uncharacterized membrane protein YozB (DUF420 family)